MTLKKTSRRLAVLAVAAVLTANGAFAQQSTPKAEMPPGSGQNGMMSGSMGEQCKQMMAMHSRMMAEMKAMNAAEGTAKVDSMAAVITEMATQRTQMMAKTSGMQGQMMVHMGEHMDKVSAK